MPSQRLASLPHKDPVLEELARLRAQGLSYLACARKLGVTRNVVSGLIYRHFSEVDKALHSRVAAEVSSRCSTKGQTEKSPAQKKLRRRRVKPHARTPQPTLLKLPDVNPLETLLTVKDNQCKEILSENIVPAQMCGRPRVSGSYCHIHAARNYAQGQKTKSEYNKENRCLESL